MEQGLQLLSNARKALDKATTFDETKTIRDQAEAMHLFAHRQKYSVQCINHCFEIKIRAERKLGQMLLQTAKLVGWQRPRPRSGGLPTLKELGIDVGQSRDWQRLATLDDSDFEPWVERARAAGERLTLSFLLDKANEKLNKGSYRGQTPKVLLLHLIDRVEKLQRAISRVIAEKEPLRERVPREMQRLDSVLQSLAREIQELKKR